MPLYDYECEAGHRYEKRESFGSPAQQPCEECGKPARRLLSAPPIVFKGSGWYVTDSKRTLRSGVDSPASSTDTVADTSSDEGASTSGTSTNGASEKAAPKKSASKSGKKTSTKAAAKDD